jgi:hypothetical protein
VPACHFPEVLLCRALLDVLVASDVQSIHLLQLSSPWVGMDIPGSEFSQQVVEIELFIFLVGHEQLVFLVLLEDLEASVHTYLEYLSILNICRVLY